MWSTNSLEKTLTLGKIQGKRRGGRGWDGWMASPTQWTWGWASSGRQGRTGKPRLLGSMGSQRVGLDLATEQQQSFLLGRKAVTNLDSILKSRDITMLTKVHLVKAMVFPVVRYECENWTIKKAECQRIDAFYLWCWRRLLRIPWTARRSNHSILKAISPEYSLKGLMLKLKFQYFSYLMRRCEELTHWKRPWCW